MIIIPTLIVVMVIIRLAVSIDAKETGYGDNFVEL